MGDIKGNNFVANRYSLSLKCDLIQLRTSNLMNMIEPTPTETIMYNDVVINNRLVTDQYIIIGPKITDYTWTENLRLSSDGTITATRAITTTGSISTTSGTITTTSGNIGSTSGA
ncbi:MAG: hypothetical protein ACKPKO_61575 [Candidatus Fonsibacter sp.]